VSDELRVSGTRDFDATVGPWIEPGCRLAVAVLRDPDEARDAVVSVSPRDPKRLTPAPTSMTASR
jgi:hypothetical protein